MKKISTIMALFFLTSASGQVLMENSFKIVDGLTMFDSISKQSMVGNFYRSLNIGYSSFQIDPDMSFQEIEFSCMGMIKIDSGSWTIQNHNSVLLNSNAHIHLFEVVKLDSFYFFVMPDEKRKFVEDLQATKAKFRNARPFELHGKTYSVDYMIAYSLSEKYYAKEIQGIDGP